MTGDKARYGLWVLVAFALVLSLVTSIICIDLASRVHKLEREKADSQTSIDVWRQKAQDLENAVIEFTQAIVGGDQRWKSK